MGPLRLSNNASLTFPLSCEAIHVGAAGTGRLKEDVVNTGFERCIGVD